MISENSAQKKDLSQQPALDEIFEVAIIGGATAGLSAALVLGRCGRKVLICDAGHPRNHAAQAMHGYLSRDGIAPSEFLRISRNEVAAYPSISFYQGIVISAKKSTENFALTLNDGKKFRSHFILLTTGIVDELPSIPGFENFYGITAHHCPYCDGWEHRNQAIAIYGQSKAGVELAKELYGWSNDLVLCTNGAVLDPAETEVLVHLKIAVVEKKIAKLEGENGKLAGIRFFDGQFLPRRALFFSCGQHQPRDLADQLGCCKAEGDMLDTREDIITSIPGVFAAGNSTTGLQMAIIAAAEGAKAGWTINQALLRNDLHRAERCYP